MPDMPDVPESTGGQSPPNLPHNSQPRRTLVLRVSPEGAPREAIAQAARVLRSGGLVAFPTETVYGLGADATNPEAVAGIFTAKGRPTWDPLIVHVPELGALPSVVSAIPPQVQLLAERFWPGPLTLVLPRNPIIPASVAAGGPTIGVRIPSAPVAQALLREAGVPVAAPSANRFMHTSPTRAEHVLADLDGRIDCLLDGGPCSVGVESTVLDLTTTPPRVLRPGGVTLEALREALGEVEAPPSEPLEAGKPAGIAAAPGQMARHYAPRARMIVFDAQGDVALQAIRMQGADALARGLRVGALLPDEEAGALADLGLTFARLGPASDLAAVSRQFYGALRSLDESGVDIILAHTFGSEGLGLALRDRLRRASGGTLRSVQA